jgi:YD repeat-containing protein
VISNNGDGTFTDTLGVTALAITGGGAASSPRVFTYKVANQSDGSSTAAATVSYVTYTIQTTFGCSDSSSKPISETGTDGSMRFDLVDRVTLADGTFYQFTYEPTPGGLSGAVTGRIASVTLPTGGTINYQYSGGCNGNGMNADGTVGSLNRVTGDGTRSYGRSPSTNGSTTTLSDEVGNQALYTITNSGGLFYETHRQVYQGSVGGSTPLLDRQICYNGSSPCDGAAFTLPITGTDTTTSQNGVGISFVHEGYDNALLVEHQNWTPDHSTWLGTRYYSYTSLGRLSNVHSLDGTGAQVDNISYGYDEGSVSGTSGVPQHQGASGTRGNQTSSHIWINVPNSQLDTTTSFYDTGVPVSSTDPNGTTQYTYDPTQGLATQVTPPTPSSGVSLPTYASFDANSGLVTAVTDANNTSTPLIWYTQFDKLLRPTRVNTVDGGVTIYT